MAADWRFTDYEEKDAPAVLPQVPGSPCMEAILHMDNDGRMIAVNQTVLDMLACAPVDCCSIQQIAQWSDAVTAQGLDGISAFMNSRSGSFRNPVLIRCINKRGEALRIRVVPKWDEDHLFLHMVDVSTYVDARDAAEARARTINDLVNNLDVAVFSVVDPVVGILDQVNPAFVKMLGYDSVEQARGARAADHYVDPSERGKMIHSYLAQPGFRSNPVARFETQRRRKDNNEIIDVSLSVTVAFDDEGMPSRFDCAMEDISDRKKAEQNRLRLEKAEALSIMAGGLAHDFNNILTAILGNVSLVMAGLPPDSPLLSRLTMAEGATIRARELTRQLLTFAKGGSPIKESGHLLNLIEETARFYLPGASTTWSVDSVGDLPGTEFDASQMAQVFSNLLLNAQRSMDGQGHIQIEGKNESLSGTNSLGLPPGNYLRIDVSDTGHPIPPDVLTRLFDPYFRMGEGGSGFGLASAMSIVRRHGGSITVASMPRGTRFSVYLPALPSQGSDATKAAEQLSLPEAPEALGRRQRVLVMDDEPDVRETMQRALEAIGLRVDTAADGFEAMCVWNRARNDRDPFALVIMDLTVKGGAGGEHTIRELLKLDPAAKAIVSSGYSDASVMSSYRDFGFAGVLPKPYTLAELRKAVVSILFPQNSPETQDS